MRLFSRIINNFKDPVGSFRKSNRINNFKMTLKTFAFTLLLFPFLYFSTKTPIIIKYKGKVPPDSLTIFVETFLRLKKYNIISADEAKGVLFGRFQNMSSDFESFSEGKSGAALIGKVNSVMYEPIARVVTFQIFWDSINYRSNIIDSVKWQVKPFPSTDTLQRYKSIRPETRDTSNTFEFLKKFLEYLLIAEKLDQ